MRESEALREMLAERLDPITLAGMMARRDKCDIRFAREMHSLFRSLAGNISVNRERDRLLETVLRRAGAPRDAAHLALLVTDRERDSIQALADTRDQRGQRDGCCQRAIGSDILLAEPAFDFEPEPAGELRVVADFRMRIERQVKCEKVAVVFEQRGEARRRVPTTRASSPRQK